MPYRKIPLVAKRSKYDGAMDRTIHRERAEGIVERILGSKFNMPWRRSSIMRGPIKKSSRSLFY